MNKTIFTEARNTQEDILEVLGEKWITPLEVKKILLQELGVDHKISHLRRHLCRMRTNGEVESQRAEIIRPGSHPGERVYRRAAA